MKRTGNSKLAVVGWGRGMGHTGHMYLADAVITQAADMKADPYFFVSKTVGKDDPLFPEEKLSIYQTVFPQQKNIFTAEGNLLKSLERPVTLDTISIAAFCANCGTEAMEANALTPAPLTEFQMSSINPISSLSSFN